MGFTICKWSVQFWCCALWNWPTVKGDFWCTLMPGKALDWRHHQNWVYAQLLPLTSPYFSNARDQGLTTWHEPLFWYPGPRALPYTSWVKLGEGPCASNKGQPKPCIFIDWWELKRAQLQRIGASGHCRMLHSNKGVNKGKRSSLESAVISPAFAYWRYIARKWNEKKEKKR